MGWPRPLGPEGTAHPFLLAPTSPRCGQGPTLAPPAPPWLSARSKAPLGAGWVGRGSGTSRVQREAHPQPPPSQAKWGQVSCLPGPGPARRHTASSTGHVAFLHFCSHSFMHRPGGQGAWGPAGHWVPTGSCAALGVRLASRFALRSRLLRGLRRRSPPRCSSPQEAPSFPPLAALPGGSLLASHGGAGGKGARGPARRLRGAHPCGVPRPGQGGLLQPRERAGLPAPDTGAKHLPAAAEGQRAVRPEPRWPRSSHGGRPQRTLLLPVPAAFWGLRPPQQCSSQGSSPGHALAPH